MYFKNRIGTVCVIGNKLISENQHATMTLEIKDDKNIKKYFLMEVENLKIVCLEVFGHF